jgi:hypothetical protein
LKNRFLWFLIFIAIGAAGGLAYGWYLHPLRPPTVEPGKLLPEYQADYVLMVAEVYKSEKDSALAAHRLAFLSDRPAVRIVQEAILTAGSLGYSRADLDLLAGLAAGVSQTTPPGATMPAATTPALTPSVGGTP